MAFNEISEKRFNGLKPKIFINAPHLFIIPSFNLKFMKILRKQIFLTISSFSVNIYSLTILCVFIHFLEKNYSTVAY